MNVNEIFGVAIRSGLDIYLLRKLLAGVGSDPIHWGGAGGNDHYGVRGRFVTRVANT
jgi:hypothetical protein